MSLCAHCEYDEVRRNGLCNSCSLYEHRTGRLPSNKVLYNREQRRKERGRYLVQLGPELTRLLVQLYAEDRNREDDVA